MKVLHIIDAGNHTYRGGSIRCPYHYGQEMVGGELKSMSVLTGGFNALMNYIPMLENDYFFDPEVENYFVVCFDSRSRLKKKDMYPFYKSNRSYDSSMQVHSQLMYAEDVLNYYGYVAARVEGYEADDIAYSLWKYCKRDYDLIILHSSDKDWAFMIDEDTVQFAKRKLPGTNQYDYVVIEKANYATVYHMQYNLMILSKVLQGDSSDGVKGIGKKFLTHIQDARPNDINDIRLGDARVVKDLLLATAKKYPAFPIEQALTNLDVVTPETVDVEEIAYQISVASPKKIPFNYLNALKPQTRNNEHRELFYTFVENARTER